MISETSSTVHSRTEKPLFYYLTRVRHRLFRYRKYRIPEYRNQNTGISAIFDVFFKRAN